MKRNASIGQRLGAGFALLLLVGVGFLLLVQHWHRRSIEAEHALLEKIQPLSAAAEGLERSVLYVDIAVRAYLARPDATRAQVYERRVGEARAWLKQLSDLQKDADGDDIYLQIAPLVDAYLRTSDAFVAEARTAGPDTQSGIRLAQAREAALNPIGSFVELQQRKLEQAVADMQAARSRVTTSLYTGAAFGFLFFILLAHFTAQSIRRPANELLQVARKLREGDWKPAMAWAPSGEAGLPVAGTRNEMLQIGQAFGSAAVALERREQRLRADREVANASTVLSKEAIAGAALKAIAAHLGAPVGVFFWREPDGRLLRPIAALAVRLADLPPMHFGEGIPGQAAAEARTVVVRDIPRSSPFAVKLGYDRAPPRAVVAVPVVFQDQLFGVLLVGMLRDVESDCLPFLENAAAQVGLGLHNVSAYEDVQRLLRELGEKNEEVQAQNEELQLQNEEIQAQNEEIQAQNEELQVQREEIQAQNDELMRHAEDLRRHSEMLADADRRKNDFLGLLAHELRNPMAAISNSLYLLARAQPASEQVQRAQGIIDRQTRQLTRLVDDLLDIARISSGKIRLQREPLDVAQLVRDCMEDHRGSLERHGLILELSVPDEPVFLHGDRARLAQVLGNLVDNAIKFSNAGQRISVGLQARADGLSISVADNGIGIEPGLLPRLLEPFAQADRGLERSRGGLGLGLSLVKGLVELHGGALQVHSDGPGRGAEFTVLLPLADGLAEIDQGVEWAEAAGGAEIGTPRRILIVEDNVDAADSLRDALAETGHEVHLAYTALEALAVLQAFRPEIVLCDIGLPTMDGYEFARHVRQDGEFGSVFLVAMTGYASAYDKQRAAEAGFDRHLAKPVRMELLNQVLAEANAPPGRDGEHG